MGVLATMPRWMRKLGGTPQSRVADIAITAITKPIVRYFAARPEQAVELLAALAPRAVPVVAPVLLGVPPEQDVIWSPAEAYRHFGKQTPREQYATLIRSGTAPQPYPVHHHEPVVEFAAGKAPRTA